MTADESGAPLPAAIADEAARRLAEAVGGGLSVEAEEDLEAWLTADPRHARAYAEMDDLWRRMADVPRAAVLPGPARRRDRSTARIRPSGRWRGARRLAPAALAASLVLAMFGVAEDWPMRLRADAMTATGERRTLQLVDGSRLQLDTHSAVAFDFRPDRRMVRLLSGEAVFMVAPDPRRPFTVVAGDGSATALGTRFLVRREGDGGRVVVAQHRVRVAAGPGPSPATVVGEDRAIDFVGNRLGRSMPVDAADALAWTDGALVFRDAPLSRVVAGIGRYHRGYVGITGRLAARRVSGVFRIEDPVAAIDQLQRAFGLGSIRLTDRVIVLTS